MARDLTEDQVKDIAAAVASVGEVTEASGLRKIVEALRESKQTAFSDEDIKSMLTGMAMLEEPVESRPRWKSEQNRGSFFVFEGLDRSGKSTQSRKLREHLESVNGADKVKWMCFPARETAVGCLIDLYLRRKIELGDRAVHLLFSANRWEMSKVIIDDVNRGLTVVCDRYAFSGVAYTAAKGFDFEWCQAPDQGLPCPDGVFFMRVDPEVGAARANFGDERYENAEFQTSVRAEFQEARLHASVPWNTIDGSRGIEEIHEEIKEKAAALTQSSQGLRRLWAQE